MENEACPSLRIQLHIRQGRDIVLGTIRRSLLQGGFRTFEIFKVSEHNFERAACGSTIWRDLNRRSYS